MRLLTLSQYIFFIQKKYNEFATKEARSAFFLEKIFEYNEFLNTPLTLEVFTSDDYFKDMQTSISESYNGLCDSYTNVFSEKNEEKILHIMFRNYENHKEPSGFEKISELAFKEIHLSDSLTEKFFNF